MTQNFLFPLMHGKFEGFCLSSWASFPTYLLVGTFTASLYSFFSTKFAIRKNFKSSFLIIITFDTLPFLKVILFSNVDFMLVSRVSGTNYFNFTALLYVLFEDDIGFCKSGVSIEELWNMLLLLYLS